MKKALIFLLMLFMVQANAQTNPITGITISLPANPDANTANWGTGVSQLTITANGAAVRGQVNGFVVESKILVIIKKNGAKICGTYTNSTAPSSNFNTLTKVWSGSSAVSLLGQSCILQPGDYELSVQFFGYSNGKFNPLSDEKTKAFSIRGNEQQSYQAPQNIAPLNETIIKESDLLKPISFRWTPVIPRLQEPVTYRLRVWQLMQGQNGVQARTVNQPIFTKDVDNLTQAIVTNLYTGPCKPPYLCDFIWNVQALNREGKPIGGNNGTSENFTFKFSNGNTTTTTTQQLTLVSPANGTILNNKRIDFTWLPPSPIPPINTYKIKIVEIVGDQSPEQAVRTNKPIFEKDSMPQGTYLYKYPTSAPVLKLGKKYAWAIEAFRKDVKSEDEKKFRIEGHIGHLAISEVWKFSIEKQDTSKEENTSRITLIAPANGSTLAVGERPNFSWKITVRPVNDQPTKAYKIKIVEIVGDQSPEQAIRTNKPIFEKDSMGDLSFKYPTSAPVLKSGKKYAWAIGAVNKVVEWTDPAMFKMANCDVNLSLKLRSVECLPDVGRNKRYKINFSSTYISSTYNLTYTQSGSGLTAYHPSYSPSYSVTNTTPVLQVQNSGSSTTVNYTTEVAVPIGQTAIKLGLQGDDKDPGPIICKPGAELDINLPQCTISICDCGEWGPLVYDGNKYECGSRIKGSCKKPFQFTSSYQCTTKDKDCIANTTWEVRKGDALIKSGTGTNTLSDGISLMSNGTYTLTLNANCGEKKCPPCTYTIIVEDCKSDVACDCGTWSPINVQTAAGVKSYDCGSKINWNCKQPFNSTNLYKCNLNDGDCLAKMTWEVKLGNTLIQSGSGSGNAAFTPVMNGVYVITLNAVCNGIKCKPCTYMVVVEDCRPVTDGPKIGINNEEYKEKKDKADSTETVSYYYDLEKYPSYTYTEIFINPLPVQFYNDYATSENLQLSVYDPIAKKTMQTRAKEGEKLKSITGLNRLKIDLNSYKLESGKAYLLMVSDFKTNYQFNFKIANNRGK